MVNKRFKIISYTSIVLVVLLYLFFHFRKINHIYLNGKVTSAYVYEINHGSLKGSKIVIKYYYFVNGKKYYDGIDCGLNYYVRDSMLYSYFPLVYDSTKPKNNELMVSEKSWQKLKLNFPDSLNWLKKYYPDMAF
jgi:hypothetical protein